MLTQTDLDEVEKLTREIVQDEIRNLPTKEEFFGKMDKVMGELQTIREEHTARDGRVTNHEERIEKIEKMHPEGIHYEQR